MYVVESAVISGYQQLSVFAVTAKVVPVALADSTTLRSLAKCGCDP
jgi:hypothetical protein